MTGSTARRVALVVLMAMLSVAFSAQAAFAGTTIYSSESPAPGSTIQITNPLISLVAVDPYGLYSSVSVKVDSTSLKARYTAFDGRITAQTSGLTSGWHTVTVSTLNWAGQRNYHTWSFRVATPPKLSTPLPGNGTTVNSVRPDVSALVTLASGATVSSTEMTIDGTVVGSSYDPATRRVVWSKDRDLADERTHSVVAKVTDSNGLSATLTWSFMVQRYEDMAQPSCVTCHSQMPLAHDTSSPGTCFTCHNPSDEPNTSPIGDCVDCHYWVHGPEKVASYDCTYCHSKQWALRIASHDEAPADYHQTTTAMDGCACHSTAITREHARRTDDAGVVLTCATCHQSTDSLVQDAIGTNQTACAGCHTGAAHESLHELTVSGSCAECHASGQINTSLTTLHIEEGGMTCEDCHDSPSPTVQYAIANHGRDCSNCHEPHSLEASFCYGCHESNQGTYPGRVTAQEMAHMSDAPSTKALKTYPGTDATAGSCINCHPTHSAETREAGNALCAGCHDDASNVLPATFSYQGQAAFGASPHGGVAAEGRTSVLRSNSASFAAYESTRMPTPADPGQAIAPERLGATMNEDALRLVTKLSEVNGGYDYQAYRFKLPVDASSVDEIVPRWSGFGEELANYPVSLSLWNESLNAGSGGWEQLFSGDTPLQAAVKASRTTIDPYADADGYVWMMASAKNLVDSTVSVPLTIGTNSGSSANLSWSTLGLTDTRIDYGVTDTYGQVFSNPTRVKAHNVTLGMLSPGIYHYRVTSTSRDADSYISPDMTFGLPSSSLTPVPDSDVTGVGFAVKTMTWTEPYAGVGPYTYIVRLRDYAGNLLASRSVIGANTTDFTLTSNYYRWSVTAYSADGTPFGTSVADDFQIYENSGSCPFLFTYDGSSYQFEADNFTAGRIGGPTASGYQLANPNDAYILKHTPATIDGNLTFKLVEERREVDYLDAYRLYAVDAPAGTQVFAEKAVAGTTAFPPLADALHTVTELSPPVSAVRTDTGEDVLAAISAQDGSRVVLNDDAERDFTYKTLELDFGAQAATAPQFKVVMDAVSEFPVTPEGIARRSTFGAPTKLEVQQVDGSWLAVPKTTGALPAAPEFVRPYVFDLTSALRNSTGKARFTFLFKTHIDYLAFDLSVDQPLKITEAPVTSATLGYHGVDELTGLAAESAYVYDSLLGTGVLNEGAYTRYGEVGELLTEVDDKFVIMGQGDELSLSYRAPEAPEPGHERRYVFSARGYYKDVKTDLPQTVEPLPFAAMSNYPYPDTESYPTDAEHTAYRETYNTRVVEPVQTSQTDAGLFDAISSAIETAVDAAVDVATGSVDGLLALASTDEVASSTQVEAVPDGTEVAWREAEAGPEGLHHSLNTDYLALEISYRSGAVAAGGCAGCHAVHGETDASNGSPVDAALTAREDRLCTGAGSGCHASAANSTNGIDVASRFTANADRRAHHDVSEADQKASGAKVACSGCHDPHTNTQDERYSDPDSIGTSIENTARNNYVDASGKTYMLVGAAHDGVAPVITTEVFDSASTGYLSPTVRWNTNEPATTWVEWGPTTEYGSQNGDDTLARTHSTTLLGLTEGVLYHYRVYSLDALGNRRNGPDRTFTPLLPPAAPVPVPVADYTGNTGPFPFVLNWSPVSPSSGTLVDYYVEVQSTSGAPITASGWIRTNTTWTAWLTGGTYRWRVKARNASQITAESSWSAFDEFVCTELYPWSGSCPFLFTNDGTGYAFESDNFTAGRIGGPTATGYQLANPNDAYILKNTPAVVDGQIDFRLVEERREIDYLDEYRLYTIDAPAGTQVFAEKAVAGTTYFPPLEDAVHTVRDLTAPVSAVRTDTGEDVLAGLSAQDGTSVVLNEDAEADFTYKTLELDFGAAAASAPQFKVVMDAVSEFPVTAEGIARRFTFGAPTKLEVEQADGTWLAVPKTTGALPAAPEFVRPYIFDLTQALAGSTGRARFTFLFKTHIDYLAFDVSMDEDLTITEVPVASATLQHHGVDEMIGAAGTTEYVYDSLVGAGVLNEGAYTRYGEVKELLTQTDDKFVIMGQGDELALSYTAPAAPAEGVERRFVFSAVGYYKDAKTDLPQTVEPLPFAAMSNYPYPDTESYPTDAEHTAYRETYNTRIVEPMQVSEAETGLLDTIASAIGSAWDAVVKSIAASASDFAVTLFDSAETGVQVATVPTPVHYSVNTDYAHIKVTNTAGVASTILATEAWQSAGAAPTPSAPGVPVAANEVTRTAAQDGTYLIGDGTTADQEWNWQVLSFAVGESQSVKQLMPKWIGHGEPTPGYYTEVKLWNFATSQWDSIGRSLAPNDTTYVVAKDMSDNAFCLKCHDGTAPDGTIVPSTLKNIATSWGPGGDAHGAYLGTGTGALAEGYKHGSPALGCETCHDTHGSSNLYHIPTIVNGRPVNVTTSNTKSLCLACHEGTVSGWHNDCAGCHIGGWADHVYLERIDETRDCSACHGHSRPFVHPESCHCGPGASGKTF